MWCLSVIGSGFAAQWTVGIYMCADNGFNDQAYVDLAEMKQVGSTEEVNIVVQVDNAARDSNPDCRRYLVKQDALELVGRLGEVDMADTATLRDFASFLAQRYPAERYFLVLWDHGSGWHEGSGPGDWIFIDESPGFHTMGVAGGEFRAAMAAVRRALGRNVTVLGFDACLMGMLEVACEAQGTCDYMLASEALVPWGGWPYHEILNRLVARPTATPREFLPRMCDDYLAEYPTEGVCLSALDMAQFGRVLPVARAVLGDSLDPTGPGLAEARGRVQTFSLDPGHEPCAGDDNIDFIDLWQLMPDTAGIDALRTVLEPMVAANAARGTVGRARGAAAWFPDNYLAFKRQAGSYAKLAFADSVPWLGFLNCYFGRDDVRPARPEIRSHRLGGRGDVRLYWSRSYDIAPVEYCLQETRSVDEDFADYCEDFANWSAIGWTTSERQARSPTRSFFSGSGPNLDNQLVLAVPRQLDAGGLLSFYAYYDTEENIDSAGRLKRDVCRLEVCGGQPWNWQPLDSFYGPAPAWHERRYVLPAEPRCYLRFRYVTDQSDNRPGVFIDDIKIYRFGPTRTVAAGLADTTFYLFNLGRGTYRYLVTARDSFGNVSMASQLYPVVVEDYAEPHTRPAPFAGPCELRVDFPPGDTVDVSVHTISGTLVKTFKRMTEPRIEWDGRNQAGKELADGLYLVTVRGRKFRKVGRIAKVAR